MIAYLQTHFDEDIVTELSLILQKAIFVIRKSDT